MTENSDKDLPYYLVRNESFGIADAGADLLHPEMNAAVAHESLSETQYFSFVIPEAKIHSNLYLWHHPNLGTVSGGGWVWQGSKRHPIEAELNDFRLFMRDDVLNNDLHDYRLPNSYGVRIVEPLKRFHVTYSDPERQNSFDLEYTGLIPPVMTADRTHFEQPMKVSGKLVLRGTKHEVDGYAMRDRSWGKPRQEDLRHLPPLTTMSAVFGKDFSFCCFSFDDTEGDADFASFALPPERRIPSGSWISRDGQLAAIVEVRSQIERDADACNSKLVMFEMTDDLGRTIVARARTLTSWPSYGFWPNQMVLCNSAEIECEGHRTYGEIFDLYSSDYLQRRAMLRSAAA
jgi:hypothetical protein